MPQFDEKHVKLCGGTIVWDGITNPDTIEKGAKAGQPKWSLKVVFPPNCPDLPIYQALADRTLLESEFRGTLPHGGYMPLGIAGPQEFDGMFPGWTVISFKTTRSAPQVFDAHGAVLTPMQYGPTLYSGQKVDVLAHCYAYNQVAKGVAAGMDGIELKVEENAPRLNIGGSGVNAAGAFGGAPAQGQPPAQQGYPAQGQPPAQQHGFMPTPPDGGGPVFHDDIPF